MRKVISIFLIIILCFSNSSFVIAQDGENNDDKLINLISEGEAITDDSSAGAFVWVSKVLSYIENYTDSYVYNDIKNECTSAKGYSSISTFNCKNKIIGYLNNLKEEIDELNAFGIEDLISSGKCISDDSSPEGYKWLNDVLNGINVYTDSYVYNDIKNECISAKGYSSISTFNCKNKILGYLQNLLEENNNINLYMLSELISRGNTFSDDASSDAYKWLNDIIINIKNYKDFSVYNDIVSECTSAKGYSSISTFNCKEKIIAYLMLLLDEVGEENDDKILSEKLISISIVSQPKKIEYKEGEYFDPTGLKVNATYQRNWSNGNVTTVVKENVKFYLEKNDKLSADDVCVVICVNDKDTVLKVIQEITVNSYVVSEELVEIIIQKNPNKTTYVEGEFFNPEGMIVNASIKKIWSNNYVQYDIIKNVNYKVNTSSPLQSKDTSWIVSYIYKGVVKNIKVEIIVSAKESKVSKIGKISSLKLKGKRKCIVVKWKKMKNISGYQLLISRRKNFLNAKLVYVSKTKNSYTKKHLKSRKKYYVRIRAYKEYFDSEGKLKILYGDWKTKSVKTK